ncbi:hypothetical protein [Chryseobacterium profundimaris]|uniref:Uncharacterized protein n=1 Tax=Chryseobacterium profundimaris TaxID=1387275 RepID=A0ABY1PJK3_9FLAO|nr:hypothetical protein [Chryseobacterium profundimaris]SMP35660.1 hypothetical protein SAMN06264346_12132 [Chryseobacterium profundimaris]
MKKILLAALISVAGMANANMIEPTLTSTTSNSELENSLKRIKIDEYVTDVSGTTWHIYGWVDVSIGWSGPKINHYDIHMVGGGHHYHFQGKVAQEKQSDGSIKNSFDGVLTENDSPVEVDSNIENLLYQLNDNVIKNNP